MKNNCLEVQRDSEVCNKISDELAKLSEIILSLPEEKRPGVALLGASSVLEFAGYIVSRSQFSYFSTRLFLMCSETDQMASSTEVEWQPLKMLPAKNRQ